ncbi:MAG: D-glycero-beta-D-manno-heptose 1-phosphate adenylyltransferase [Gemmatimonadales bacterium]
MTAPTAASKVLSRRDLVRRFGPGRAETVVFTNGCFELLHAGHVDYLERASSLGDALVVGVNSDASARRLAKGKGRPIVSEADRARVVAALASVDAVCVFEEDTPEELIRALLPDVLVKGADYALEDVAGRDIVEDRGGRVELLPLLAGRSTTDIITRAKELTP